VNPSVRGLNARGVAKYNDFGHFEDYISETVGTDHYGNRKSYNYELSICTKIGDLE